MTTTDKINIVKVLLKHIGEDPQQDKALAQGAIIILGGTDPEGTTPSMGDETPKKKTETKPKKEAPKKRKPFDSGRMTALLNGGWSVAKIADDMGCSVGTIYDHMKKEGLAVGKQ